MPKPARHGSNKKSAKTKLQELNEYLWNSSPFGICGLTLQRVNALRQMQPDDCLYHFLAQSQDTGLVYSEIERAGDAPNVMLFIKRAEFFFNSNSRQKRRFVAGFAVGKGNLFLDPLFQPLMRKT